MIPFWWACWTAPQTLMNSSSRCFGAELLQLAELGDRDPAHQLHDEVRPCRQRRSGVEHSGDVGVIHHRQRLALDLEARDHLFGVHPELDDLECDPALHRLELLSHVDCPEAADADLLEQLIVPDNRSGALGVCRSGVCRLTIQHRLAHEGCGFGLRFEQLVDALPECLVTPTSFVEVGIEPLLRGIHQDFYRVHLSRQSAAQSRSAIRPPNLSQPCHFFRQERGFIGCGQSVATTDFHK